MARLDKLWRETGGPCLPPYSDSRRVKAQVNAALDASSTERRYHMKQKWRVALAAGLALAAITGTAFAAAAHWDILAAWFQGDTAPGQAYVDSQVRQVSDENYTLTVEGVAADEQSIYLAVCITARSDEARAFLHTEEFTSMDTFSVRPLSSSAGAGTDASAPVSERPGDAPAVAGSFGTRELESSDENSRRFALDVDASASSVDTLRVRCGYMEKGKAVDVPIVPAGSRTVTIGATGQGVLKFAPAEAVDSLELTIGEITLSPFTCTVSASCSNRDVYPNLRFCMGDGTVLTQAQTLDDVSSNYDSSTGQREYNYRFQQVQDLNSIAAVIVFDRAYPLDGSESAPVAHDPALDPFTLPRMERLSEGGGYTLPVQELTETLGGIYTWDAASQTAKCTYRSVTVTLKAGSTTALVDGQEAELSQAPAEQGGVLTADCMVFEDAWGIDCCLQQVYGPRLNDHEIEIIWRDWYIVP